MVQPNVSELEWGHGVIVVHVLPPSVERTVDFGWEPADWFEKVIFVRRSAGVAGVGRVVVVTAPRPGIVVCVVRVEQPPNRPTFSVRPSLTVTWRDRVCEEVTR